MTTIVGIFDNARDLDEAVERLAEAGIEETVFDEAIVAEEAGIVSPALSMGIVKPDSPRKPDRHTIVQAFRDHLADYRLPDAVIEGYATTFFHKRQVRSGQNRPSARRASHPDPAGVPRLAGESPWLITAITSERTKYGRSYPEKRS